MRNEQDLLRLAGVQALLDGEIDYYDLPEDTRSVLYGFYVDEMPYGVQKARTGDPGQWIVDRLERLHD